MGVWREGGGFESRVGDLGRVLGGGVVVVLVGCLGSGGGVGLGSKSSSVDGLLSLEEVGRVSSWRDGDVGA